MERNDEGTGNLAPPLEWSAPRAQRQRAPRQSAVNANGPDASTAHHHDEVLTAVVTMLRDLLAKAELGILELEVVTGLGLASVREQDNVRCALVVELPPNNQSLSPREMQIAGMVADGATNRAIASMLDISLWTVSTHLRRIFAKLGVSSRAEMVGQLFGANHLSSTD
jgi:DNA-binding CsgD family transcriptional regulator